MIKNLHGENDGWKKNRDQVRDPEPENAGSETDTDVRDSKVKDARQVEIEKIVAEESGSIPSSEKPIEITLLSDLTSESKAKTSRNTGLAFSAGISLFGAVVFMMLLGWLIDLFIGTAPFGIVGGIILGSVIGFIQFFRTTSQILNPSKSDFEKTSLFSDHDDENIN